MNNSKPNRRSIRLRGYDYSRPGSYYITICTQSKISYFGEIYDRKMVLNQAGEMVRSVWNELPKRFININMDEMVIMPNHLHGIFFIHSDISQSPQIMDKVKNTVGEIVGAFKSISTNQYIQGVKQKNWKPFLGKLWQGNYFERVIRDEDELRGIREYIINNPLNWETDEENPTWAGTRPTPTG